MAAELLFLFNHDAPHQVAHIAGIASAARALRPDLRVTCATGTDAIRQRLTALLGAEAAAGMHWLDLSLPAWKDALLALPNRVAPVRRIARLDHHRDRLLQASVLVAAERTCLRLRRGGGAGSGGTRFVHVPHGAGDRAVTFHSSKAGFDLMLVSGPKTARELVARGTATQDQLRIVGYPKFDTVDRAQHLRLFDNDRPVFVYNPHFDPFLSSWYDEGPALLDWFASAAGQAFNLVFAPHVMLFRKRLHVSLEYRTARLRPDIRPAWRDAPNILIDTGGTRLFDMSYTLAADAYIGDVSSQIYEFLLKPRAAFFIDRFSDDPRSREGRYPAWQAGDVVRSAQPLTALLPDFRARAAHYRDRQQAIFADTFSVDPAHPASLRAAQAIIGLLP